MTTKLKLFILFALFPFQLLLAQATLGWGSTDVRYSRTDVPLTSKKPPLLRAWRGATAVFTGMTECHSGRPKGSKSYRVICDGGIAGTANLSEVGKKLAPIYNLQNLHLT